MSAMSDSLRTEHEDQNVFFAVFHTAYDNEKALKLFKFEQEVTKKGREVSKEWKMIKEEEVGCPEEVESGEECYRNSLWVKGERLIFITNERCVTFDEDLN